MRDITACMKAILFFLSVLTIVPYVCAEAPLVTRIIVLDNENLIEGTVTKTEEGIEIQQKIGGTVTLPPRRILAVVESKEAALEVVSKRKNLRDADERLRLAYWCQFNGMPELAKREATAALAMRANFTAAANYLKTLEAIPGSTAVAQKPAIQQMVDSKTVKEVPNLEYNTASFAFFATKVHPVLLNACATCHSQSDVKAFSLVKLTGRENVSRNLMNSLPYIDAIDPEKSTLLVKAITPHGNAKEAPFRTRNHPAYQTLEAWVLIARAPEGTLSPLPKIVKLGVQPETTPLPIEAPAPAEESVKGNQFGTTKKEVLPIKRVEDPFDPDQFNKAAPPKP